MSERASEQGEAQIDNCRELPRGVYPLPVTAPELCARSPPKVWICSVSHFGKKKKKQKNNNNKKKNASQSVYISLCQLGFPEPWLEITNLTSVFLSRLQNRPVGLIALHWKLLAMNYYQRTVAIWAVPLSLRVISNVLATFLLGNVFLTPYKVYNGTITLEP